MNTDTFPKSKEADIALLLEGSYPFIKGGVSEWVHQIIQNLPQYRFALIFLGSSPENYQEGVRYPLPKNVVHLQINYLFPPEENFTIKSIQGNPAGFEKIRDCHEAFRSQEKKIMDKIGDLSLYLDEKIGVDYKQFLYSKASWDYITEQYNQNCTDPSFIHYFWTIKNIHKPLWQLAKIVENFPQVKILHSISTGYAGFLGALLHHHYKFPLILTEHGIYTKERRIDIFRSQVFQDINVLDHAITEFSYSHHLWNRFFETLARLCYNAANPVISLFNAAQTVQLEGGATPEKSFVIPNGIDLIRFGKLRRSLEEKSKIVCFIGRKVPIKDVKGFIRAIAIAHQQIPAIQAWIIGAEDEDPQYAQECHDLAENLSLQNVISFKLHQVVDTILPEIQLLVLSSISESMPLVILESFAAGIPVVATNVGACHELIFGHSPEDKAIGSSGTIVRIADPKDLATAMVELLTKEEIWKKASDAAIQRVEKFYNQTTMINTYQDIYRKVAASNESQETMVGQELVNS